MRNAFLSLALATAAFSAFAAGPTSATAIDAKAGESVSAGRMVVPLDFGWRFHWGKVDGDPRAATFDDSGWRIVDLPHDAQIKTLRTDIIRNGDGSVTAIVTATALERIYNGN